MGTGRALLTTTVILACAFGVQFFASFRVNQTFGVLAAAAIAVALICDLVVLPSVIRLVPLTRWAPKPGPDASRTQ